MTGVLYSGSDAHGGERSPVVLWRDAPTGPEPIASLDLASPSWVVPHPRRPVLYATEESEPGAVVVIGIGPDGVLRERQRVPSYGSLPCHLETDADGSRLAVSNYLDGTVAAWRIDADGTLDEPADVWRLTGSGPVLDRQEGPHAHAALFRPDGILVVDLGADALLFATDDGTLRPFLKLPPGFGPRHLTMVADRRAVLVGELSAELALVDLSGDTGRILDIVPTSARQGAQPSGITTLGRRVVVANRGVGTLAEVAVEADRLVRRGEPDLPGINPRAVATVGDRVLVALQDAGSLLVLDGDDLEAAPLTTPAPHIASLGSLPSAVAASITV